MSQTIAGRIRQVAPREPQGHGLRVIPIAGPSHDQPPYRLLEAETMPFVKIAEISESGSVPELQVENALDVRVFLMDGQELIGAKQNRILNADVLVPPHTTLRIPVSCVEQGRWNPVGRQFSPGKAASNRTRAGKSRRVHESLRTRQTHDADQGRVWQEVAQTLAASQADSDTMALHAAYDAREQEFTGFRGSLSMPPEAVGLAVFHGQHFRGLDLFDRHTTLRYFWESLIDSYAVDWLSAPVDPSHTPETPVSQMIQSSLELAAGSAWEPFASPGEGVDWRLDQPAMTGSALVWEESVLLHLQLFPKDPETSGPRRPRLHRRYGHDSQRIY